MEFQGGSTFTVIEVDICSSYRGTITVFEVHNSHLPSLQSGNTGWLYIPGIRSGHQQQLQDDCYCIPSTHQSSSGYTIWVFKVIRHSRNSYWTSKAATLGLLLCSRYTIVIFKVYITGSRSSHPSQLQKEWKCMTGGTENEWVYVGAEGQKERYHKDNQGSDQIRRS